MNEFYELSDGFRIPKIGFGTFSLNGFQGTRVIEQALQTGYRLIDTAFNYDNEGIVGKAIRNSSIPRDQIVVSSKLAGRHHSYYKAFHAIEESLSRLGLDYIDLYLIHWPNPKEDKYVEAWQAMIDAQNAGLIRSIGTSNFLPEHIERIEKDTKVLPVINQVELHPLFSQSGQREYHQSKGILTQAWSPLGHARDEISPVIQEIANKYKKTYVQIILRWELQLGVLPIPKASSSIHQLENFSVFDFALDENDMQALSSLSLDVRPNKLDPANYQEF